MKADRHRLVMAQQKAKQIAAPQQLPDNFTFPKLTAEQRKAIYAPKPANTAPQHLQGNEWVTAWKLVSKATYSLTAITAFIFGGVIAKESRKGIKH